MSATAKRRPFRLAAPVIREAPIQKQIADMLRIEIARQGHVSPHGVVWWADSTPDSDAVLPRTRTELGMVEGTLDLFFLHLGMAHFIELKAADGELRLSQRQISRAILGGGGKVGVACTAEQLLRMLDTWRIPRAGRVRVAA